MTDLPPIDMTSVQEAGDLSGLLEDDSPYRCVVCGTAVSYSGKGPPRKYCDDHRKNKTAGTTRKSPSMEGLRNSIADLYRGIGFGLGMIDQFDGMAIADGAPKLADAWITLAESDPKVKKFLIKMTTGSGWGAVIIAHAMVAMPIMAHHELLPKFMTPKDSQAA